jgi:CRP/FNR family transcriptional regulator, nitrogen oxide reductase regulator
MPALHRSLIKSLPVFSAMNDAELDDVIGSATALRIPKGSAVFERGETAKAFYVLLKVVKVTPDGPSRSSSASLCPATSTVSPRRSTERIIRLPRLRSSTASRSLGRWRSGDDFMERHPRLARNVMQMMGQRIQEAHVRLKELATQDVEHRVEHGVLRLVSQSGRKVEGASSSIFRSHAKRSPKSRHNVALCESRPQRLGKCWARGCRPPKGDCLRSGTTLPHCRGGRWQKEVLRQADAPLFALGQAQFQFGGIELWLCPRPCSGTRTT